MLVSLISYVDRNTLALLAPTILAANQLSAEQYGLIISAFSVAYMVGNPLWGRLLDRYGVRWGMPAAVGFWTLASGAHALVSGFWGFVLARAALGFGEGATFPGALRVVVQTLPDRWRARGIAIAYSGGSLGAVVTPWLMTPVNAWFGWRGAFLFTALIGAAWLLVWRRVARRPELAAAPPRAAAPAAPLRWTDRRLWAFLSSYALGCLPLGFVLYGASLFLNRVWHKSQNEIGAVLWIPPLGWELGYFLGGWLLDRFQRPFRALSFAVFLLIAPLAAIPHAAAYPVVLFLLFWSMFVAGANVIFAVGYATETFGVGRAGLIAGLGAGSWSAVVAVAMPRFGRLFDLGRWNEAFAAATLASMLGTGLWLMLQRNSRTSPSPSRVCSNGAVG
jgi:ACS family hexuronate transporter-like MFS transporter